MPNTTPRTNFARAQIALHWGMAVLIAAVFALIELRELFPKGSLPRETMKTWHFMLGLAVLVVVALRIGLRFVYKTPPITPAPSPIQVLAGHGAHIALYGLMIVLPLLGWLLLSAEGKDIPFFGLSLPPLAGVSHNGEELYEELHETLGTVFYVVIALHAAAALFHHYLLRDNTLKRMLPARGQSA